VSPRHRALLVDLLANLVWPVVVLTWGSGDDALGPRWGPVVAMLGPLAHASVKRLRHGRASPLSVLVIVSIALNAASGFIPLTARWFAWKEALLPVGFGLLFAGTARSGPGLLSGLLDELVDADRVRSALDERGTTDAFASRIRRGTLGFGAVVAASGVLSGALARVLVTADTGTPEFASQLGRYTAWSWPAVTLPTVLGSAWVLRGVLDALEASTGRPFEDLQG
jgi:hypothetical protein